MTFYTCFDEQGAVIARCQTEEEIAVLRRMGRPIAEVKEMKNDSIEQAGFSNTVSDRRFLEPFSFG